MEEYITKILKESQDIRESFFQENLKKIENIINLVVHTFQDNGKLLLCGNGGSAADCQHIAAEFVNRFQLERNPLPAIALTTDTSVITSIGNDYGFNDIFSRQVKAIGNREDLLICISTTGNSWNLVTAVNAARKIGMTTIGILGGDGGKFPKFTDNYIVVNSRNPARIQEVHILIGHIICELVEIRLKGEIDKNKLKLKKSKVVNKLYYIETDMGCGIRVGRSEREVWKNLVEEEGKNHALLVRIATADDIDSVKRMGGYIPNIAL